VVRSKCLVRIVVIKNKYFMDVTLDILFYITIKYNTYAARVISLTSENMLSAQRSDDRCSTGLFR